MILPRSLYLVLPFSLNVFCTVVTKVVTVKTATTINAATAPVIRPTVSVSPISHITAGSADSYTSNNDFTSAVLNSTNMFRKQHDASPLSWNETLAEYAASHASGCVFAHTHGPYGENLAAGYEDIEAAVDSWGNERDSYNFADGGFSMSTGHFTQLVWKATTSVGCGRAYCNKAGTPGWYLMCEYYPAVSIPF